MYQDVKALVPRGYKKVANNTDLVLDAVGVEGLEAIWMRLHGSVVAKFYPSYLTLYSARWFTNTTKNRLNLALEIAKVPGSVVQEDWCWWYMKQGFRIAFVEGMRLGYDGTYLHQPIL